uniref:Uncharacterized protein n=1 Tax=Arundo donax TaxID=35708 RepID=A0A0A8YN97_ARUDO
MHYHIASSTSSTPSR